jgi:hypothetical protein
MRIATSLDRQSEQLLEFIMTLETINLTRLSWKHFGLTLEWQKVLLGTYWITIHQVMRSDVTIFMGTGKHHSTGISLYHKYIKLRHFLFCT